MARISLVCQPSARQTRIVGLHGGRIRIQLAAPPVDGAANDELCRFLASVLGLPRREIRIVSGLSARIKTVECAGITAQEVEQVLLARVLKLALKSALEPGS